MAAEVHVRAKAAAGTLARAVSVSRVGRIVAAGASRTRLTVMLYHRLVDPRDPDFDGDPDVVSACPAAFEEQIRFLARNFSVVSLEDVAGFVDGEAQLPERPALITFDDGYLDNLAVGASVLRHAGLPAVLFLTTGFVGSRRRPWWDECAYLFGRTDRAVADTATAGRLVLDGPAREASRRSFVARLKAIPHAEIDRALEELAHALGVDRPGDDGPRLFVDWNEVRAMERGGVSIQPHTRSHPILSRLEPGGARREIAGSAEDVSGALGRPSLAFAYPNGRRADIGAEGPEALRGLGIPLGFTTSAGPVRLEDVRARPLEIPRINVHHRDDTRRFAFKALGFAALAEGIRAR